MGNLNKKAAVKAAFLNVNSRLKLTIFQVIVQAGEAPQPHFL